MILLRSALFNVVFFAVTFLVTVAATVVRFVAPHRVHAVATLWAHIMVGAARVICGMRLQVTGLERIPPGPVLIAPRHQSAFDTFVWLTLLPHCCYVLKRELLAIPLFGKLLTAAGMIAVDRRAGGAAIRSLLRDGERAARGGRQIVIFPEGTRHRPGLVGDLQPGVAALAARTNLPVIPVATDSGLCWGRRAFRKRPGTIRIMVGEPIEPGLGRHEVMRLLRERIGSLDGPAPAAETIVSN